MGLAAVIPEVWVFDGMCREDQDQMLGFAMREWSRAHALVLALIDAGDRSGMFKDDGHGTPVAWVQATGNMSRHDAEALVATVRALRAMPFAAEAFADGGLGVSQLGELVKLSRTRAVRARLEEADEMLLGFAQSMCFADFTIACRHFREVVDPDGTHRAHAAADQRRNVSTGVVGEEFFLHAHCGTDDGAKLAEILDKFTEAEFLADMDDLRARCGPNAPTALIRRTHAQRRADALLKIFTTAATATGTATSGEAVVNYVIDDATFAETVARMTGMWSGPDPMPANHRPGPEPTSRSSGSDGGGGGGGGGDGGGQDSFVADLAERVRTYKSQTDTGIPIDPYLIVAAAINGRLRRIVVDPAGVPVDVGRKQRFFTGPLRDVLRALWERCCQPGCDIPAGRCEIDHIIDFTRPGGETRACNASPACDRHNRWKHANNYRVWLDPTGQWHTYRPNGTEIAPRYDPIRPDHPNGHGRPPWPY